MWMAKVAKAWSMPSQLVNIDIDWESRASTRILRIFRAALAAIDCPFRTTWPHGLPLAIMSATVAVASLLIRRVLRERTSRLQHGVSGIFNRTIRLTYALL
jgi:hypothetical protein